jgi:ribosomal protein S18 acetylase RimI-like enzyme
VKIAPLPEELFSAAVTLWHECGLTRPWNDPRADLVRAVSGPASAVLGARDVDGRLLGTAMVGHDGHRGWVYYLAVAVTVRRQGLGRDLMRECEEWVRSRGVPKIQLMVRHSNEDVIAFYEGVGYTDGEVVVLGRFLD